MKKLLLLLITVAFLQPAARAGEGMWIPMLIGKNYSHMLRMGLKLSKDDLYSINHSSLKDAVVQFAGGCTAEVISKDGLLLTNHHCGYDAVASLSTVQHDYLDDGFFAHNLNEEMPAEGITVIFLQRMEDVTDKVIKAVGNATGKEYDKKFEEISKQIEDEATKGKSKYIIAHVKPFFHQNQYFLLVYKQYVDVRLVGTPPKSLGKFGGDTDNWMWPRHTCDFSMFRIYAGKDNEPAPYAADNVPYHPKKYLPISLKGEHDGDYAMIYGYPGRTNRYEVSYGVNLSVNVVNPSVVSIRDLRLSIMHKHMEKNKAVYLKLTSLYSRISNYWKYYIGQTEQLKRLHVIDDKRKEEAQFTQWATANNYHPDLMDKFAKIYDAYTPFTKHAVYYYECFRASAVARIAASMEPLYKYLNKGGNDKDSIKKYVSRIKSERQRDMKDFDLSTEQDLLAQMTRKFYDDVTKVQQPDIYQKVIFAKFGKYYDEKTYNDYATYVFKNTFLIDSNKFNAFCENPTADAIKNDPAAQYAFSFVDNYTKNYQPKVTTFIDAKDILMKEYMKGLMEWKKNKLFYPDANFTMRITYGKVRGYNPRDAVYYNYFTTLDGLMAKYVPGSEEFDVPKQLITLYKNKDYGRYADEDGTLHTCFITTNDITGGNSGSPVMNANGELIGAAFDGNWEAMSGDIAFDKKYKRTIVCDIRFILFVVDKMGHAKNLIHEMDIRD